MDNSDCVDMLVRVGHESDKGLGGTKKSNECGVLSMHTCCISATHRPAHWSKINENNPEILKKKFLQLKVTLAKKSLVWNV